MKKVSNTIITRFETECFWIDIVDNGMDFEAWLSEKSYGISVLIFGCGKDQGDGYILTQDKFMEYIEDNLDDYRYDYYREYN